MSRYRTGFAALAVAASMVSSAAQAQTVIASNPQSVVAALEAEGHRATLHQPDEQAQHIESWHNGREFLVLFYNCDEARANCHTLQFYFGFSDAKDTTLDRLNEWNKTKRFVRAYRDDEGDPVLEMDVDTDPDGVSQAWFHEQLRTWRSQMDAYREHIGAR
jgi:hypothetical protein